MSFPFGNYYSNIILDGNADQHTVYFFNPIYKTVPVCIGEPTSMKEVIDWDATANVSAVILNVKPTDR